MDNVDVYELGVRQAENAGSAYQNESTLVSSLLCAHRSEDWEDEIDLHMEVFTSNTVPNVPIFRYLTSPDVDTRPIASEGGWIEARAAELGLSCSNFKVAESILNCAWAALDPFETPFRYVVPEPEIPVFVRNLLTLINTAQRAELVSTYRGLQTLAKEREGIQDAHTEQRLNEDRFGS